MIIEKDYNDVLFSARARGVNVLRYLFDMIIYNYVSHEQVSSVFSISGSKLVRIDEYEGKIIINIREDKLAMKWKQN